MKHPLIIAPLLLLATSVTAQECQHSFTQTAPNMRYVYSEQGTIRDKQTGLTWMRCQVGKTWNAANERCDGEATGLRWQSALQEVTAINHAQSRHVLHEFAGIKHWRLPNIKELVSLTEAACFGPSMNQKAFAQGFNYPPGTLTAYLWSQSPHLGSDESWVFDSINGEVYHYSITQEMGVLLVADK